MFPGVDRLQGNLKIGKVRQSISSINILTEFFFGWFSPNLEIQTSNGVFLLSNLLDFFLTGGEYFDFNFLIDKLTLNETGN